MATLDGAAPDSLPAEEKAPEGGKYLDLSREELIALLDRRDRDRARIGIHWAADRAERDSAFNDDFVALRLVPELCDGAGPWDNLVIEGDNFDALRWLRMTMRGRVKCIFVDPPYNTGNQDWVYNDHFRDPSDPFHDTTWLEFLHRRFLIARDLLADDGVLFVCINDEKRALLELMLDATLPGMKVGSLVWRTRAGTRGEGAFLSGDHEHLLVYAGARFRFGGTPSDLAKYKNPDDDPRGPWVSVALQTNKNFLERPRSYQPFQNPSTGHWHPCNPDRVWSFQRRSQEGARGPSFEDMLEGRLLLFGREGEYEIYATRAELDAAIDKGSAHPFLRHNLPDLDRWVGRPIARGSIRKKQFLSELKTGTKPLSSWVRGLRDDEGTSDQDDVEVVRAGLYQEGTGQLRRLMKGDVFPNPKPVSLVRNLLRQSSGRNDLILDFFGGSGTTAQAVIELNGQDGFDRRFVMVSHDEATEDHPDRNLTRDVLAQRIRRLNAHNGSDDFDPTPFGYLRTRLIPTDRLLDAAAPGAASQSDDLLPEDVWLAVQAMHALPLSPFIADKPVQIVEDDVLTVAFCDTVTDPALDRLRAAATSRRAIHCYCWTPGPVRRALEGADAEIHRLPSALWDAFRS